jgi:antitoxin component of MazEF toxin-antitoxin module
VFERKIVEVGKSSLAVIIPYAFVRELGIKKGDFISFKLKGKKLLLEKLEREAARDERPRTPTQVTEVGGDWRDVR